MGNSITFRVLLASLKRLIPPFFRQGRPSFRGDAFSLFTLAVALVVGTTLPVRGEASSTPYATNLGSSEGNMAFDAEGNLYVPISGTGIKKITPAGEASLLTTAVLYPEQLVYRDGALYSVDALGSLKRIALSEAPVVTELYADSELWLGGLALDDSGNFYLSSWKSGAEAVYKLSPASGGSGYDRTVLASGLTAPWNLAYYGGAVYIADRAKVLRADGNTVVTFATGLGQAITSVADGEGNLYVVDQGNRLVKKLVPNGSDSVIVTTVASGFSAPLGLALDGAGYLYVFDNGADGGTIFKVSLASAPPTVTAVAPASGSPAGGTSVTLTGTNFSGATAVSFGASPAMAFTVGSDTQISATSPAGSAGTVNITVTTAGGTSATSAANQFTYAIPNTAPTFVGATTTLTVAQNSGAADVKSLLHVSDSDSSQTETWSTSSGPSHGTLTVTGATATSGSADITPGGTITYAPAAGYSGADSFTIQVSDGSASVTRTITVSVRSNDATLSNLTLSAGTLSPSFASGTVDYTASVANAVSTVDVTATCAQSGATIKINGASTVSGNARSIGLNVGDNTITIDVLAEDGATSKTYSLVVNRVPAADLSVTMTDSPDPVSAGGNITYTITVANNGPQAAAAPSLSNTLPAGTTFVSLSAPGGWSATTPAVGATGTISASASSLASGASAAFTLVVAVDSGTAHNTTFTNTATVSTSTLDPNTANDAATATTTVTASANLAVTVTAAPVGGASAGNIATYSITITNNGPQAAATAVIYAKLSGRVTLASAAPDSAATSAGWTLFNSPAVGTQDDIYFTAPSLANGASATLVVQGTIDPSASQGAGIALRAVANSLTPEPDSTDNEFTLNTLVGPALDTSIAPALTNLATGTRVSGNLYPAGHVDAYSFTAHAGDRVFAGTATTASSDATNGSRDTVLRIARSDGVVLELDDDDGGLSSTSSSIAGLQIPADGTYYIVVECLRPEAIVFPYDLYVRVQSGAPAVETADSATGQTMPASGWIAGATSAGGEVDSYQITLAAGESLFASLDLDPERDSTGWDARLTLKPLGGDLSQSFQMNGSDLTSDTPPSSEAIMFTAKEPGVYVLEISSADGSSGNYQLSTSVLAAPVESTHGFTATDANLSVPDGGELSSTVSIPSSLPIGRLKVALHLNHPDIPSLDVHLTSPSGNTVGLVRDAGAAGNNVLDVVFDDTAAYALGFAQQDPDTPLLTTRGAVFRPGRNYRLGWFSGQDAQGTWTLTVRDRNLDTVTGTLVSWSLIVVDEAPALTGVRTDHFTTDFETNDGGFTHSGTGDQWTHGTPNSGPIAIAHSGTKAWKTNLAGNYESSSTQDLVSPDINLTGVANGTAVQLSWAMSYQLADASTIDAAVSVEEVGGANASEVVWRWLGPTMQDNDVGSTSLTIDEAAGWAVHRALISDFAGKTVRLRFHLRSTGADQLAGLAIDDVTVSSYRAASTDATLSNLVVSAGSLSPVFASGTTSYTASVPNAVSGITVTPTATDSHAAIKVNNATVVSGNASGTIALNVGANVISTTVTAEDGTTTATYAITVTRDTPPPPPGPTPATIVLSGLKVPFDGTPKAAIATTTPSGLSVRLTYNGSTSAPTAIGSYAVVATITSSGYEGSGSGTLVIGPALPPVITQQPSGATIHQGGSASFSVSATGVAPLTYQWLRNGAAIAGATSAALSLDQVQPGEVGYYSVIVTGGGSSTASTAALLEMTFNERATGGSMPVGTNIEHPNGNVYDQFLMTEDSTSVKAEPKKVVRASFIDLDDDIVQVEFSGAGTLTIRLEDASDPAAPAKYVQPGVNYVKGHATVEITGADKTSNLTIFSVGKITAVNQSLFRSDVTYDGIADLALVTIQSVDGQFGSVRTGNAHYFATNGLTGLYAPDVSFDSVFIGDITGADDAIAVLLTSAVNDARITGGNLEQLNGGAVEVGELTGLQFTDGQTSDGTVLPAQTNHAKFERAGIDVTAEVVP